MSIRLGDSQQETLTAATAEGVQTLTSSEGDVQVTSNVRYERNGVPFIDSQGVLWLFYARADTLDVRNGGDPDNESYMIYWVTSTDGGNTWTAPTLLDKARPANFNQRDLSAFEDDSGNIWVFASSGDSGANRPLIWYRSSDRGLTWTDAFSVDIPGEGESPARLGHSHCIWADGKIWLTYQESGAADIRFSSSLDGVTWTAKVDIHPNADGMAVPKIARTVDGLLYVVMVKGANGQVHLSVSDDDGATWTDLGQIAGSGVAWGDWDPFLLTFRTLNKLVLFWAPNVGANGQLLKTQWSPGGISWAPEKLLTDGGYGPTAEWWNYWPMVIEDGTLIYLFYSSEQTPDGRSKNGSNIWLRRISIGHALFTT